MRDSFGISKVARGTGTGVGKSTTDHITCCTKKTRYIVANQRTVQAAIGQRMVGHGTVGHVNSRTHTVKSTYSCHPPVYGTVTVPLRLVVKSSHPVPPVTMRNDPVYRSDDTTNLKLKASTATGLGGTIRDRSCLLVAAGFVTVHSNLSSYNSHERHQRIETTIARRSLAGDCDSRVPRACQDKVVN